MMEPDRTAQCMNTLGTFCGPRDIPSLTPQELKEKYGLEQADLMILFGGSIPCGGDILANAMRNMVAKKFIIVGGAGHTTEALRAEMHRQFPEIPTAGLPEAQVFAAYLKYRYGLVPDYLECRSTNCGNNITYLLDLLREQHVASHSMIFCQDAAMQLRMAAGLKKHAPDTLIINYAAYRTEVRVRDGELMYLDPPPGMWSLKCYLSLLMGEFVRLRDDAEGYGPKGKNYIAHVDIPQNVCQAYKALTSGLGNFSREANPLYASVEEAISAPQT